MYYIVRNENFRQTWNWKCRAWCWDLDADYSHYSDGYGYRSHDAAVRRQRELRPAFPTSDIDVFHDSDFDALKLRTVEAER